MTTRRRHSVKQKSANPTTPVESAQASRQTRSMQTLMTMTRWTSHLTNPASFLGRDSRTRPGRARITQEGRRSYARRNFTCENIACQAEFCRDRSSWHKPSPAVIEVHGTDISLVGLVKPLPDIQSGICSDIVVVSGTGVQSSIYSCLFSCLFDGVFDRRIFLVFSSTLLRVALALFSTVVQCTRFFAGSS